MLLEISVFAILGNILIRFVRLLALLNLCNIETKPLVMYGMTLL